METILDVQNLQTYYRAGKQAVPAVDGVSFTLAKGEVLGIVGESGSGKSTVVRSIIRLLDKNTTRIVNGKVLFHGKDLLKLSGREMRGIRGKSIAMVFQNPLSSLNPVYTIGNQIQEAIRTHESMSRAEARDRALHLLKQVNIPSPELRLDDYPHQLSGGMQQRVLIAMALACQPEIMLADEPTTALDVTIQSQILELLSEIRDELNMSVILITHNMGVIAEMCDRMLVMYGGVVMEEGTCTDVFANPLHPYTRGLLASIPSLEEDKEELYAIPGQVPHFRAPVSSCRFCSRCDHVFTRCREQEPPSIPIGEGRSVRCWLYAREKDSDHGQ
ncbi:ABC transporter ATP-binding protein [Cohnella cellulosilytica]|uniref:ABC transporter ATP-binding protein n=1 Tax=Cohnella cellulosilytica TaxID=986710 RepID=A0ABW2FEH6_9BACL